MPLGSLLPNGSPLERLGKYKILQKIGAGAMGAVYRAVDPILERDVAIKILTGDLDATPDLRKRFLREARSAGQLSHKNIITIFDLVEEGEMAYMVMEFLEGEDLQTKIARRLEMALEQKIELMLEMCEGLGHAHQRGIIHRDIKPGNIFITHLGQLKILDFGLAHFGVSDITKAGSLMGTPNYMSPEQVRGEKTDERSDIFSMGAVFYELLTGKKPFTAPSLPATFLKIIDANPDPPESVDPRIPRELAAVVLRALAKEPDRRYQKVNEIRKDLETVSRTLEASKQRIMDEVRGVEGEVARLIQDNRDLLADEVERRKAAEAAANQTLVPGRELEGSETVALPPNYLEALLRRDGAVGERARIEALVKRRKEIAASLAEAVRHEKDGDFEKALRLAEQVLAEIPFHAEAEAFARRMREGLAERARKDEERREVTRLVAEAKDREHKGDTQAATELVEQALALDPKHAEAGAMKRAAAIRVEAQRRQEEAQRRQEKNKAEEQQRRVERAVAAARKALAKADFAQARREIETGLAVAPDTQELQDLLSDAERGEREAREARERKERLAARLAEARAAEAAGNLEEAIGLARSLTTEDAANAEARELLERAEARLRTQRQREEAENKARALLTDAESLAGAGDYTAALSVLQRADSSLLGIRQTLERYREAARAQDEARRRTQQIEEHLGRGKKAFERGEDALAQQELQKVLELAPDHAEARKVLGRVRDRIEEQRREQERRAAVQESLRAAVQALSKGKLAEALAGAERTLSMDPKSAEAARLRAEAERRLAEQRQAAQRAPETIAISVPPVAPAPTVAIPSPLPASAPARTAAVPAGPSRGMPPAVLWGAIAVVVAVVGFAMMRFLKPSSPQEAPHEAAAATASTPPAESERPVPPRATGAPTEAPRPEAQPTPETEKKVARARQHAKTLLDAGKLDEAAAALGEALQIDPSDPQAVRLMTEIDQRSRRSVESASAGMNEARTKAQQAKAGELAPGAFEAARQADQEAQGLLEAKHPALAAKKLSEAADGYRRAESEARSEAARREAEKPRTAQTLPMAPPTTVDQAALAAQRQAEEARQAQESAARLAERDRGNVLAVLQRYRAALEGKDLGSLKGIWPTMSGGQEKAIRDSFQFTRSMRMDLQARDVQIAGDQATVRCQRHDEMVSVDGQKAQTDTAPTFLLRRKGDSWIIEAIR